MSFLPFCPDSTKVVGQLMMNDRWVGGSVVRAPRGGGRTTWSWSVTVAGPNTTTPTSLPWSDRPCNTGGTAWRRTVIRLRSNSWRGRELCRKSRDREREREFWGWYRDKKINEKRFKGKCCVENLGKRDNGVENPPWLWKEKDVFLMFWMRWMVGRAFNVLKCIKMNQGQLITTELTKVELFIVECPEWSLILLRIMLVRDRNR